MYRRGCTSQQSRADRRWTRTHVSRSIIIFQLFAPKKSTAMDPRVIVFILFAANMLSWELMVMGACANCVNGELSVKELTNARIEYVKQQILKKLRLTRRPAVAVPVNSLPMPVAEGQTLSAGADKPPEFDDYYGRTEQKIIFPVEGMKHYLLLQIILLENMILLSF